jgi:hypothetical protein
MCVHQRDSKIVAGPQLNCFAQRGSLCKNTRAGACSCLWADYAWKWADWVNFSPGLMIFLYSFF